MLSAFVVLALVGSAVMLWPAPDKRRSFCDSVRRAPSIEAALTRLRRTDAEQVRDEMKVIQVAFRDLAEAAPGDIRREASTIADVVDSIAEAVTQNPGDRSAAAAQVRREVAKLPDLTRAQQRLAAYIEARCGFAVDQRVRETTTTR